MSDINWYPGHMARSRRLLEGQLRSVDAVVELCDARAPASTRNPELIRMAPGKARVLVLNKADLADDSVTALWLRHYESVQIPAVKFNASRGKTRDVLAAMEAAARPVVERMRDRGANKTVRMMVIGIPNVGKSSLINRLCGKNIAQAQDRPGVTRANRWIKVSPYLDLLDTPGLLWPRLSDQRGARTLAYLGSIRDQIMDQEALAGELMRELAGIAPDALRERFRLDGDISQATGGALLEMACRGRGWLLSGGRLDTGRGAQIILDEFRSGKIGRITLEKPVL
ncbi:MAG: ribosome biogenesis GTPase YlqF [Clostridia bacterium]|nr:ribosome biogenesis GTPase YlqF [Clostridia bacterium]